LSFVIAGAANSAIYFCHYIRPPWHANPVSSLRVPISLLKYLAGYFGSSWVRFNFHLAGFLGLAGLIIALAVALGFWSYVRTRRVFAIELVLTLLFCGGTAFITGLGRLNFGIGQSFASRYQTIALLFWCCLGLTALLFATATEGSEIPMAAVQICLLGVMASGALRVDLPIGDARLHGFRLDRTTMSVLTGVSDDENFKLALGLPPRQVAAEIQYLRSQRLSVFSSDAYLQLGTPLKSRFRVVAPQECRGALESTTPLESMGTQALGISGWAWDYKHQQPPIQVVATVNGVITGLAAVGDRRPAIRATNPYVKTDWVGFAGYVRDVRPTIPVNLYAVLGENPPEACLIATVITPI